MPSEEWPGTYELELLAAEIRLNDPRTERITLGAKRSEIALAKPATSPALVDAIVRAGRSTRG